MIKFRIIICGWKTPADILTRCLNSIEMQDYPNKTITVSIGTDDSKRMYLVENTFHTIYSLNLEPEDVLILIDADDFLLDENALKIISNEYESDTDLLLTYGSYVNFSNNKRGKFNGEYLNGDNFRASPWRASHLKTFKVKLWKCLPFSALQHASGEWYKCCADRLIMIPLMEMAGYDRIKHIDWLLYCYDDTNPEGVWRTNKELSLKIRESIEHKPSFQRIDNI